MSFSRAKNEESNCEKVTIIMYVQYVCISGGGRGGVSVTRCVPFAIKIVYQQVRLLYY